MGRRGRKRAKGFNGDSEILSSGKLERPVGISPICKRSGKVAKVARRLEGNLMVSLLNNDLLFMEISILRRQSGYLKREGDGLEGVLC